ncbi:ArsR/SmtB family transcription factor [Halanaerobium hydrogeniformans]|uniref:Regulatory protein ArsR n=1 Tax=Halanaerobium hydrogeniformans TaxID=656519 RepID=E4RM18_HALHG|nr:metalloregulator ArsR/SmtB family transcription factor [Halanaerobium hydrogeniformans]ADQ14101.1 regulatory protein ArsR [Halanaerobium hydrogeniformans]
MVEKESLNQEAKIAELAELAKALGHRHRVKIIKMLAEFPENNKCMVSSIVEELPIAQSTVSQHLKILKEAGWIEGRIDGPRVCYCLKEGILEYFKAEFDQLLNS